VAAEAEPQTINISAAAPPRHFLIVNPLGPRRTHPVSAR
jgi:hypothetical protein